MGDQIRLNQGIVNGTFQGVRPNLRGRLVFPTPITSDDVYNHLVTLVDDPHYLLCFLNQP